MKNEELFKPQPGDLPDHTYIVVGGKRYEVPPIAWARLRRVLPIMRLMDALGSPLDPERSLDEVLEIAGKRTDYIIKIFAIAMSKKYPDMTAEVMEEALMQWEVAHLLEQFPVLMKNSGFDPAGENLPSETKSETTPAA